ncbi:biopolymer transporter ExbD [uncultured Roseobacter sp.]|uniref:ExbD/TolR family protein n=1 Tax=uncultured Roseobacter sp. TaxID=114847 RepID=UPI00261440C2|nr:biopolymer transporter ExbD [uncultured Roseobacter sp.]
MARQGHKREPTIALINIVFLMLVFFMVAGTLVTPVDGHLKLVQTAALEGRAPPDALILQSDGQMQFAGKAVSSLTAFYDGLPETARTQLRLVPDRALAAEKLIAVAAELKALGAGKVMIVTERALP